MSKGALKIDRKVLPEPLEDAYPLYPPPITTQQDIAWVTWRGPECFCWKNVRPIPTVAGRLAPPVPPSAPACGRTGPQAPYQAREVVNGMDSLTVSP